MLWLIGVFAVVFVLFLWRSGCFASVQVSTTDKPSVIGSGPVTVYYKHVIGAYSNTYAQIKEALSILPEGATGFGIYYDSPCAVETRLLQSAAGVVVQQGDNELVDSTLCEQLRRRGMEKMVLPSVSRSVTASRTVCPLAACLPVLNPITSLYKNIVDYIVYYLKLIEANRLEVSTAVELYEGDMMTVHFPLDHADEFTVPEKMSLKELESKLARRKFDSDEEESSESEMSGNEDPDEEDGASTKEE